MTDDVTYYFNLRLPEDLARRVRELAERDRRSINAEIVVALERFVERETGRK